MNIKKYIREMAEKDAEKLLTEEDRQFCMELAKKTVEQQREENRKANAKRKNIKKILKFILIGISIYVAVIAIELCCLYAVQGENIWNYLKEVWSWYRHNFFI